MRAAWTTKGACWRSVAGIAATAAVLLAGAARAEGPTGRQTAEPVIGVGMLCNTSEQAERFVALRAGGAEPDQAMKAVNDEAKDPRACGIAAVAFIRDHTMDMKKMHDRLVQVVRINVIAGFDGSGWQRVSGDMVQYAVMEGEGETI